MLRTTPDSPDTLLRRSTMAMVLAMALAGAALLVAWGPVNLVPHMHEFAGSDTRWSIPAALLVLSHLPLLPIGMWGLWRVSRLPAHEPLKLLWGTFFVCQMLATVGGQVYHWAPSNATFIWDQVPKSAACALFALAFLGERIDRRFGSPVAVLCGVMASLLGCIWWLYSLHVWGAGDLRPLFWLELSPLALVAAGAWTLKGDLLLSRADWLRSQFSFAVAQTVDWADVWIYETTQGWISGHAVRHLALAACVGWVGYRLGAGQRQAQRDAAMTTGPEGPVDVQAVGGQAQAASDTSLPVSLRAS